MKYSANSVWENSDSYDVAVIGAGHAGCEAALAAARLGLRTIIFTVSMDSVALMPCNPNIGGSSKGDRSGFYPVQNAEQVKGSCSAFSAGTGR